MPVYKVTLEFRGRIDYEVEAKDEDDARMDGAERLLDDMPTECYEVIELESQLADCQYTDQQELQDEEDRHDRKLSGHQGDG